MLTYFLGCCAFWLFAVCVLLFAPPPKREPVPVALLLVVVLPPENMSGEVLKDIIFLEGSAQNKGFSGFS